ncbi:LysR family transcriptional regulator [Pelobacter seleniigenes]|uniref:LysR family transcriptional regulator n=1 Tax=Pelobacter seleniigenes TaxID=407188 RepID=UPI0004A7376F|nr:LysR family transcriptional regulator [Pelobacter seleniigenes]
MRFDFTDLRLFLHVIDAGSITGGAERAHMALAAASARIRGMEEELGTPLLERLRHGIEPTAAGQTLVQHARIILRQAADMRWALGDYSRGVRAQVKLLCNTAALTEFLPAVLGSCLNRYPHINVELQENPSTEIIRLVTAGRADLGVFADSVDAGRLVTRPFRVDQLVAIMPRHHPLVGRESVSFRDLLEYPFVGLSKTSALQEHLDHQAERLGRRIEYRVRLHDSAAVCNLVAANVGIAVVSETAALQQSREMALQHIPVTEGWARRRLMFCARDFAALPPYTQLLLDALTC